MALQVRGTCGCGTTGEGAPQRLTWNGGCDRWLNGVGLLHEGLDTGDRRMERVRNKDWSSGYSPGLAVAFRG